MRSNKTVQTSGADERTPSHPQYFSWVNNTNEGATEAQTLINLDFFRYLRDTYGMEIEIYAWDAGNLDGANGTYETLDSPKLRAQFPNGYAPLAKAAELIGARLGVWGGADGFGNTPEEAESRRELLVSLCRAHHFMLFKFDTVCGQLRADKREEFVKTMQECRRWSPDLIVLNHRNELGEAEIYATTFLWNGVETYVDVHVANPCTAPHHRAFIFSRGSVPGLQRLSEDHGVCLSSCMDGFADDLIYQAFNRCLILAPEIYANPWLLRDDEYATLARIYNLHRRWRDILVDGMELPESYGANAVIRGNGTHRFLSTGNDTWVRRTVCVKLDASIGLSPCKSVVCTVRFPEERTLGTFPYGASLPLELPPFRAVLLEICESTQADAQIVGGAYTVLHETDGHIDRIRLLSSDGHTFVRDGADSATVYEGAAFDRTAPDPILLGEGERIAVPENAQALYETTCFTLDNDSLERRSLRRSGPTKIPEVQAARDAFFGQERYALRGCDADAMFDGRTDTLFDALSRTAYDGLRVDGGCLRIDFGAVLNADRLEITYFEADAPDKKHYLPITVQNGESAASLCAEWQSAPLAEICDLGAHTQTTVRNKVHDLFPCEGHLKKAVFTLSAPARFFRLPEPMDRIFSVKAFAGAQECAFVRPHGNNLMAPFAAKQPVSARRVTVHLDELPENAYLSVALDGVHGVEGAYVAAECNGKLLGCPDRAPSYPSNIWECCVRKVDANYTYYLPLTAKMAHSDITVTALFCDAAHPDTEMRVWLCADPHEAGLSVSL